MIFPSGRQTTWEEQVSSNGLQCIGADGAITNTSICEDAHFLQAVSEIYTVCNGKLTLQQFYFKNQFDEIFESTQMFRMGR